MSHQVDRSKITFGQAEGVDALPTQLALRQVSAAMRAKLWHVIHRRLEDATDHENYSSKYSSYNLDSTWKSILRSWHVDHLNGMSDEFIPFVKPQIQLAKNIFSNGNYVEILNFVEFLCRHYLTGPNLTKEINAALAQSCAAYRIADGCVIAYSSAEEGEAVLQGLKVTSTHKFASTRSHLIAAGNALTRGNWAESVRESIHAVESVAVLIDSSSKTLSSALQSLEKSGKINPNFKRGVNALYDYTSDEKGIRHAKVFEDEVNVGETEALYMYGSCAAFVTYLIRRSENIL